jgi:FolB domain-containing protein
MSLVEIHIEGLKTEAIIGVNEDEKTSKQPIIAHVSFIYDASQAVEGDSIKHSICYDNLASSVKKYIENSSFELIETLASKLIKMLVSNHKQIISLSVLLEKPNAVKNANISVSMEWEK